jgi:hypothetical protein
MGDSSHTVLFWDDFIWLIHCLLVIYFWGACFTADIDDTLSMQTTRYLPSTLALILSALLVGCTMEFINTKAAREIKPPPPLEGDLYAGWRAFQSKCANCHSTAATGGDRAPDLLPLVREMSSRQFAELVLKRYDLGNGLGKASSNQSTVETRIDDVLRLKEPPMEMPAWQGEPAVNAHILDLYTYLSARADGRLATGRPPR